MNNYTSPVINLDFLAQLFNNVFGTPASAFNPTVTPLTGDGDNLDYSRTDFGVLGSPYYANDANGREYFMPVTMTYTNSSRKAVTFDLPFPVVSIKAVKHVVDTELTEVNGMVSELININAYKISIKGFCIDPGGDEFPESDIIALRNLFACNQPISIKNVMTDIWLLRPDRSGSDQVTIRDFEAPFEIGTNSIQAYTIEMMSEAPFSLYQLSGK